MLHVTNGDIAAELIRAAGISGEVTVTADVLHEGPAPGGLPPERWRKVRARHLAESGYDDYESALAALTRWDRTLEDYRSYDEVILWFEHDLFDQLLLIRTLDLFAGAQPRRHRAVADLHRRVPGRRPLPRPGPAHAAADGLPPRPPAAGQRGAEAPGPRRLAGLLRSAIPARLEALLRGDTSPLPFLAGALRRHLEEFPAVSNGLSALRAADPARAGGGGVDLRGAVPRHPGHGGAGLHGGQLLPPHPARARRAAAPAPAPGARAHRRPCAPSRASLTTSGREVLEERDDWVRIRGIDRWLGGVHLQGSEAAWRWDGEAGRLAKA